MSKNFKRQAVSFATTIATLTIYIPFMHSRWSIYVAMCVGYTIMVFGLAWSGGKLPLFYGGNARPVGDIVRTHLSFLLGLIGWIWFAQYSKAALPSWVVTEGDAHESWFLVFALLGILGILFFELWWLSKAPSAGYGLKS
jgi:hypothetical protein